MKKTTRVLKIIFIMLVIIIAYNTCIMAVNINNINNRDTSVHGETEITNIASYIYSTITTIGIVLSVVILAILGIKYMLGSASERADYKKTMMPYLIGAVLVFSASTIANVIYQLAK